MWLILKARQYGWAALAALVSALGLSALMYKKKAEHEEAKAETLEATVHAERIRKKIEKEKKEELSVKESEIKKEVKKKDEDFKGVDNLSNPNDW